MDVPRPPWLKVDGPPLPCKDEDPELFHPRRYNLEYREQIEEARTVCYSCPVRDACLDWAVPITDLDGIWAATTPPERRRMRSGNRRAG
jgi:WhiB family redox-sensing transcriptional regulator